MFSPTLLPLLAVIASCAAPAAGSRARQACQLQPNVPDFFRPGVKWQIEIQEPIRVPANSVPVIPTDAKVWDVDMFQSIREEGGGSGNVISRLRAANGEIFVICYFNAGGLDRESDCDADKFHDDDILEKIEGWDENYVDIMNSNVITLMKQRIEDGIAGGCDGFDPDNIDGYEYPELVKRKVNDHILNASDYYDYVKELADYAHARGKLMGQKNARGLLNVTGNRGLLKDNIVDFVVTEQCTVADGDEPAWCNQMEPFIDACKPVFQIEYPTEWNHDQCLSPALDAGALDTYCGFADPPQSFSTILKLDGDDCGLNGVAQYCDSDGIVITPTDPEIEDFCSN